MFALNNRFHFTCVLELTYIGSLLSVLDWKIDRFSRKIQANSHSARVVSPQKTVFKFKLCNKYSRKSSFWVEKFHTKVSSSPQQNHNIGLSPPHSPFPSQFRPLKHTSIWIFIFKESNFPYSLLVYFAKIEWKNCILVHIADRNYVTKKSLLGVCLCIAQRTKEKRFE